MDNTSYAELHSIRRAGQVGAEWKTASVEGAEQMEGENKKAHHQTQLKMGGEPSEANGMGKLSNQRRSGEKAAKDRTNKQNKTKEKNMVQFSTLVGLSGFVVWDFVLHKQPQEGPTSSREFQPKRKNKFENHSDRGRCDGLTASTNISVSPFALADFSSSRKKKKKHLEVIIPTGEPAAGKAVSTPLCISF